jgi:uroporphyrinogen-III synthase
MQALYLGLDPTSWAKRHPGVEVTHAPVIEIVPRPALLPPLSSYTHILVTSQQIPLLLARAGLDLSKVGAVWLAVGEATQAALKREGAQQVLTAPEATQEGMIALLEKLPMHACRFWYPRASEVRPVLERYLDRGQYTMSVLYDTRFLVPSPLPDLHAFHTVIFTSPSTVKGCILAWGSLPPVAVCHPIGPVTRQALRALRGIALLES